MASEEWKKQLKAAVTDRDGISGHLVLSDEEEEWFDNGEGRETLGFRLPKRYLGLIDPAAGRDDPIRLQAVPSSREFISLECETPDPLAEEQHLLTGRLIRRYQSRAVFLATDTCAMYCRHCFRRRFTGKHQGIAAADEIEEAARVLEGLPEVRELLISGGDPLIMEDSQLERMFAIFRAARPDLVLRIGTRVPVVLPSRVTDSLLKLLGKTADGAPVLLMTQFNHPRELDSESAAALRRLSDHGILLYNQTVLLRGVNDDADTLEELMNLLVSHRVTPYYLFQGDLASGTSHLRVSLEEGFRIESALRRRLSGVAMPRYAVDLPDGGGKVTLQEPSLIRRDGNRYLFRSMDGEEIWYTDL